MTCTALGLGVVTFERIVRDRLVIERTRIGVKRGGGVASVTRTYRFGQAKLPRMDILVTPRTLSWDASVAGATT